MDIIYSSITMFSCISFSMGLWMFLNWAWFTPRKLERKLKEQGFVGMPYRFSLGGFKEPSEKKAYSKTMNLYDDDLLPNIMHIDQKTIENGGKGLYGWHGKTVELVILDPGLVKEIALKNYHFLMVPHNPLAKLLMKGISSLDKEQWSKHRKIITPAFQIENVKLMVPAFYTSISDMLTKWEEIIPSAGSSEIDVWPYLQRLTSEVIYRTIFGSNYKEGKAIFDLQKEHAQYFNKVSKSLYIPAWRFLPTKMNRRMKEVSKILNNKIHCVIDARMKIMKTSGACGDDILGLLLESNSKEIDKCGSKEFGLSIQDVIEECKLLYVSSQETTAALLVWTMILLSRHPKWQNRAREEVLQLFGKHQIPDYSALNQLKIVTMILNEVLRLYTPASAIQRITTQETKLGDFTLPKGVILQLPMLVLHHDPKLWGSDAKEFKPERFAGGVSNATKGQLSFFPFGWGPRICLGQNFAMTEAKMAISMILQRFSFEIAPSYSHHPYRSPTIQPKYGAQLILHKLYNDE